MKSIVTMMTAALLAVVLSGCAVTVLTVNVTDADLGYVDNGYSANVTESNLK